MHLTGVRVSRRKLYIHIARLKICIEALLCSLLSFCFSVLYSGSAISRSPPPNLHGRKGTPTYPCARVQYTRKNDLSSRTASLTFHSLLLPFVRALSGGEELSYLLSVLPRVYAAIFRGGPSPDQPHSGRCPRRSFAQTATPVKPTFERIRDYRSDPTNLAAFKNLPVDLFIDASTQAWGGVLKQQRRALAFLSGTFGKT